MLVYVLLEPAAGELATIAGELLPNAGADVESAVRRIAKRFSMPETIVNECAAVAYAHK
jgi:hypothetical protein